MSDDEDPMAFLKQKRMEMQALVEMQAVAQMQAVRINVISINTEGARHHQLQASRSETTCLT
jgi:hypothetical protein